MPTTRRQVMADSEDVPPPNGVDNSDGSDETALMAGQMPQDKNAELNGSAMDSSGHFAQEIELLKFKMQLLDKQLELERLRNSSTGRMQTGQLPDGMYEATQFEAYNKRLRASLGQMPTAPEQIPTWLSSVEAAFELYSIPEDARAKLLLPHLTQKSRALIARLPVEELSDYTKLKAALLAEHRLSPSEYYTRLHKVQKEHGETWSQFASRIRDLYEFYLESKDAHDVQSIKDLAVADLLKGKLSQGARRYVLLQEGASWHGASTLAILVDRYEEAQSSDGFLVEGAKNKCMEKVGRGQPPRFGPRSVPQRWNEQTHRTSRSASSSGVEARGPLADGVTRHQQKPPRRGIPSCFNCGGLGHIQMNCPSARNVRADADERRKVAVVKRAPAAPEDAKPPETEAPVGADTASFLTARVAELRGSNLELARDAPPPRSSKAYQGQNIELACEGKEFTALLDSGCEISVIHTDVVPECYKKTTGKLIWYQPLEKQYKRN